MVLLVLPLQELVVLLLFLQVGAAGDVAAAEAAGDAAAAEAVMPGQAEALPNEARRHRMMQASRVLLL